MGLDFSNYGGDASGAMGGAATGAAIGSVVPGVGTLIGAGVGGLVGLLGAGASQGGKDQQDQAAQNIAEEQLQFAKQTQQEALGYAAPTMQEMMMMDGQLHTQAQAGYYMQTALDRDSKLAEGAGIDLKAIQGQMSDLLGGKSASMLNPIQQQRQMQRDQLVSQLKGQFGPGAETSSAGMQALNQFDAQTNMNMTQAQQGALGLSGSLMHDVSMSMPNVASEASQAYGTLNSMQSQTLGAMGSIQGRQISALEGTNTTPYAGAQYTGDLMQGQQSAAQEQQLQNTLTGIGSSWLYSKMGMGGGGMGGGYAGQGAMVA